MRTLEIILLVVLLAVVAVLVVRADGVSRRLERFLNPEPTAVPALCETFEFQKLLSDKPFIQKVSAVDANDNGTTDCVVLYSDDEGGSPVYGAVYHFEVSGQVDSSIGTFPVSDMHRHDLLTEKGRLVPLGAAAGSDPPFQPFEVLVTDADTQNGPELVVLHRRSADLLAKLCVFRWNADERLYELVGYAHGDWLETEPETIKRYVDEVVVCNRSHPIHPDTSGQVTGTLLIWQDGWLTPMPGGENVNCAQ